MRVPTSADLHMLAMTLNVLATPGLGPTAVVVPLIGFVGGVLRRFAQ